MIFKQTLHSFQATSCHQCKQTLIWAVFAHIPPTSSGTPQLLRTWHVVASDPDILVEAPRDALSSEGVSAEVQSNKPALAGLCSRCTAGIINLFQMA